MGSLRHETRQVIPLNQLPDQIRIATVFVV
jgi:hypothetical protein